MERKIGPKSLLNRTPVSIQIDGDPYILGSVDSEPTLFRAVCPHQQGIVQPVDEECLRCPDHGWEFDATTGESNNVPGASLPSYEVRVGDDGIYAEIPKLNVIPDELSILNEKDTPDKNPEIRLVAHGCLLIEWSGFRLLTDPWIKGEAFFGAWAHYPPPVSTLDDLPPIDAIWISHEHSDHLHVPTLESLSKDIPVYVPQVPFDRLRQRVIDIGFENVVSMPFYKPFELTEGLVAVTFPKENFFNDNALYLNFDGFELLNNNDAGINHGIAEIIGDVDMVCSRFAAGDSGYPLTWHNLDDNEKQEVIRENNAGRLEELKRLVELFDPTYLVPFSSFAGLCHPNHHDYRTTRELNNPQDVVDYLCESSVTVLDLLPGEIWDGTNGKHVRRTDRDALLKTDARLEYLDTYVAETDSDPFIAAFDLTHSELEEYFGAFTGSHLAREVGQLSFALECYNKHESMTGLVMFDDGEVSYRPTNNLIGAAETDTPFHNRMSIPGRLVERVVREELSWNEIQVGCWSDSARDPDRFNVAFHKILAYPWEIHADAARTSYDMIADQYPEVENQSIADLIWEEGQSAVEVLKSYDMYCVGCQASTSETLVQGAKAHGLPPDDIERMVAELKAIQ